MEKFWPKKNLKKGTKMRAFFGQEPKKQPIKQAKIGYFSLKKQAKIG